MDRVQKNMTLENLTWHEFEKIIAIIWPPVFVKFQPTLSLNIEVSVVKISNSNLKYSVQHKFNKLKENLHKKWYSVVFGFIHLF